MWFFRRSFRHTGRPVRIEKRYIHRTRHQEVRNIRENLTRSASAISVRRAIPCINVCLAFKEEVESKSGGKITVEIHPNSELGGDEAMLESVALGTLTMVVPSANLLSAYVDGFQVLGMPYLFDTLNTPLPPWTGTLEQS